MSQGSQSQHRDECLALLGLDLETLGVGMAAVAHNVRMAGLYHHDHHQALLASLRLGCSAYATATEVARLATVVLVAAEFPLALPEVGEDCLVLRLVPHDGGVSCRCAPHRLTRARSFFAHLGETGITLEPMV